MKACFKCGVVQPLSEFYRHPQMGDGHLNKCKGCTKSDVRKHREANGDRVRAYDRARSAMGTARQQGVAAKTKRGHPEYPKHRARVLLHNAVARGHLTKKPCAICGASNAHGHHEDYSKALEVVWLCQTHHMQRHAEIAGKSDYGIGAALGLPATPTP